MPRAKTAVPSRNRKKKLMSATKGYFGKKKNCIKSAKDAFWRSGVYAYRDRRNKKRNFRALWITRINAAARLNGSTYGKLISGLKKNDIEINRKVLAHLAVHEPDVFSQIVAEAANQ